MRPQRLWAAPGAALAVAMACAALAWRDCMLLATSAVLAHRLFLLYVDRGAPWRALAAAINAVSAGALAAGAGIALIGTMAAACLDWWNPTSGHPATLMLLLSASAVWCCLARIGREQALQELRTWLWLFAGTALATEAHRGGLTLAPCLFVAAVATTMLWAGWRLATQVASALLHGGTR
jgi:hypothetical protein